MSSARAFRGRGHHGAVTPRIRRPKDRNLTSSNPSHSLSRALPCLKSPSSNSVASALNFSVQSVELVALYSCIPSAVSLTHSRNVATVCGRSEPAGGHPEVLDMSGRDVLLVVPEVKLEVCDVSRGNVHYDVAVSAERE